MRPQLIQFSLTLITIPMLLCGENSNDNVKEEKISEINRRIETLEKALKQLEKEEMEDRVEAQSYFIADWPKYREEILEVKDDEEVERKILEQIEKLKKQKEDLIKNDL